MEKSPRAEQTLYQAGRATLAVQCSDPRLGRPIADAVRYFAFPEVEDEADRTDDVINMTFYVADALPAVPACSRALTTLDDGIRIHADGNHLYLSNRFCFMRVDVARGSGAAFLSSAAADDTSGRLRSWVHSLLAMGLHMLFRRHRLYSMHAAAVAGERGGVLLPAESGSGKSTLAYSLVRAGWHFLSDDLILLHADPAAVQAQGFRSNFFLDADAAEAYPEAAPFRTASGSNEKVRLPVADLFPAQKADVCVPKVLVFPEITGGRHSRCRKIEKREALHRLLDQSPWIALHPDSAQDNLSALSRLVDQTRHYRLFAGSDIKEDPSRADELLGSLLQNREARPV